MFEEIITSNEIKFNDLEKKVYKFVCFFGCLIIKLMLESYDKKIMKARDSKKYSSRCWRKNKKIKNCLYLLDTYFVIKIVIATIHIM